MFYINFTVPSGNTYRINLSETPITYLCPVCGKEQLLLQNGPGLDWCDYCEEKRQDKRTGKVEHDGKLTQKTITRISRKELTCTASKDIS